MLYVILLSIAISVSSALADPIKILVIDTQVNPNQLSNLCSDGHKSFVPSDNPNIENWKTEEPIHGTHIVSIIQDYSSHTDYCVTVYRFHDDGAWGFRNQEQLNAALTQAKLHNFDIINLSLGGIDSNETEKQLIKELLDSGVTIVAAAGNEGADLDKKCNFYPACYDSRIIIAGSIGRNLKKTDKTNKSKKLKNIIYTIGENVYSNGFIQSGTSQATGKVTALVNNRLYRNRNSIREPQGHFSPGELKHLRTAILASTDADERLIELANDYIEILPSEIVLVGGFVVPLVKIYMSGMIMIERKF